ncbi:MAG: hypothetical protein IKS11_02950 [Lachnospiraceae bacterium]|nr:hypothetical protein [Lachnospiraceae bacterium]MBR6358583.1 hypothetical protein [Lachnospiraceae bacterium]
MQDPRDRKTALTDALYSAERVSFNGKKVTVNHGRITRVFLESGRIRVNYSDATVSSYRPGPTAF